MRQVLTARRPSVEALVRGLPLEHAPDPEGLRNWTMDAIAAVGDWEIRRAKKRNNRLSKPIRRPGK